MRVINLDLNFWFVYQIYTVALWSELIQFDFMALDEVKCNLSGYLKPVLLSLCSRKRRKSLIRFNLLLQ